MSIGIWQIAIVAVLVVLLFGRGKISDLMGDVAKGIKSFKKGMKDDADETAEQDPKAIDHEPAEIVKPATKSAKRKTAKG
jgi:sec-independent protein translocase protein TatA